MSSNIEETSILKLKEYDKHSRLPNLWNLPKVDKSFQRKLEELKPYQEMYEKLLYQIGENKYNLKPSFDFTVDVVLPTGKLSDLSYHIIAGPICHLTMTVCSTQEFEKTVHSILKEVRDSVHNKSVESSIKLRKRQEEIKKEIPPFQLYGDLNNHHLEIIREQKITIFDPKTGITVTRKVPAESEPWRITAHKAKMDLLRHNKLLREFESREQNESSNENANKVPIEANNHLER